MRRRRAVCQPGFPQNARRNGLQLGAGPFGSEKYEQHHLRRCSVYAGEPVGRS